jgi:hypothetical protein
MKRIYPVLAYAALSLVPFISCTPPKPSPNKQVYTTYAVRLAVAEGKSNRTPSEKKMQSDVLELYKQYITNGTYSPSPSFRPSFVIPPAVAEHDFMLQPSFAKIDDNDNVYMYIYMNGSQGSTHDTTQSKGGGGYTPNTPDIYAVLRFRKELKDNGVLVTDPDSTTVMSLPFVQGWVPAGHIDDIARLPDVGHMALVTEPLISGLPDIKASSLTRSDISGEVFGDSGGMGIKIGIISDDCGSLKDWGLSIAPLDSVRGLPALSSGKTWLPAKWGINVVKDNWNGDRSHEGLAMMEVVHDVAPQASLYFASGYGNLNPAMDDNMGMLNFMHSIDTLAGLGCNVITDDILYIEEPAFEDGPIAKKINSLVGDPKNPIVYTSAAGNWARDVYSFTFEPKLNQKIGIGYSWESYTVHNTAKHDYLDSFSIKPGASIDVMLQWDDPYQLPVADNDFDLFLVDVASNHIVQWSRNVQDGDITNHDCIPFEHLNYYANPCFGQKGYKLFIVRDTASEDNPTPRMKLLIRGLDDRHYASKAKSIFGHAAAQSCIACGAINPFDDYNTIEPFSSLGPVEIVQTSAKAVGNPHFPLQPLHRPFEISGERIKPDVSAINGVSTNISPFEYFGGTSASAPVVAGIAARIMGMTEVSPPLKGVTVMRAIFNGCINYGDGNLGLIPMPNNTFGWGRVDAFRTIAKGRFDASPRNNFAVFRSDIALASVPNPFMGVISVPAPIAAPLSQAFVSVLIEGYHNNGIIIKLSNGSTSITLPPISGIVQNMSLVFGNSASRTIPATTTFPLVGLFNPGSAISMLPSSRWTIEVTDAAGQPITPKEWGVYIR